MQAVLKNVLWNAFFGNEVLLPIASVSYYEMRVFCLYPLSIVYRHIGFKIATLAGSVESFLVDLFSYFIATRYYYCEALSQLREYEQINEFISPWKPMVFRCFQEE